MKFFRCAHCGNIITFATNAGVPVICCGEKMQELTANTTDAATEKHVPAVTLSGRRMTVKIGSVEHPMEEKHHIEWICLETDRGNSMHPLAITGKPETVFVLDEGEVPVRVYEYCNLHGLWSADL